MRVNRLVLLTIVLAGVCAAEVAAAQADPLMPTTRQRAPGVPLSPNPGDVDRLDPDRPGAYRVAPERNARDERGVNRGADRDLPMPRPVPSIIAP